MDQLTDFFHVRLRDYGGNVHVVPNGLTTTVTDKARGSHSR